MSFSEELKCIVNGPKCLLKKGLKGISGGAEVSNPQNLLDMKRKYILHAVFTFHHYD